MIHPSATKKTIEQKSKKRNDYDIQFDNQIYVQLLQLCI